VSLVAVLQGREVGVDIEHVREDFRFDEVAERFFTFKEVTSLRALPAPLQREAFYKCWTSKEAFLKAKGTGLSGELDEVEIILTDEEFVRIRSAIQNWSLVELSPWESYVGALAVERVECRLKFLQWLQPTSGTAHRHC
jgi:4'-phosphopantetheinyl transferase